MKKAHGKITWRREPFRLHEEGMRPSRLRIPDKLLDESKSYAPLTFNNMRNTMEDQAK